MAYYLGIDGGGSKTTCVVGDEASVLATAMSGPSNMTRVGEIGARKALHEAILQACAAAKIDSQEVNRACVGVAGVGREEVAQVIREIVAEVIGGEIEVVGDMQIALQAALGAGPGVIVIAGTGSIAYGRDMQGRTARAGGWGFAISDEGSAHWIGRSAITNLLRAADEAADDRALSQGSLLFRSVKSLWTVESFEQLAQTANSTPNLSELLPAVLAASDAGDELARQVLRQAGWELAHLASVVVSRLFSEHDEVVPMAMVGGVFRHAMLVREVFYNEVRRVHPHVVLNSEVVDPVHGALQLARRGAA